MNVLDSPLVLAISTIVIAIVVALALALAAYLVGQTKAGQWAGRRVEARMDRVRSTTTARKRTKAGAP